MFQSLGKKIHFERGNFSETSTVILTYMFHHVPANSLLEITTDVMLLNSEALTELLKTFFYGSSVRQKEIMKKRVEHERHAELAVLPPEVAGGDGGESPALSDVSDPPQNSEPRPSGTAQAPQVSGQNGNWLW